MDDAIGMLLSSQDLRVCVILSSLRCSINWHKFQARVLVLYGILHSMTAAHKLEGTQHHA